MVHCDECGKKIEGLPFHCKYCKENFCDIHRLPEDHHCTGIDRSNIFYKLKKENIERTDWSADNEAEKNVLHNKEKHSGKKKNRFSEILDKNLDWLNDREHHSYDWKGRANYLLTILVVFVVSIIAYKIFYDNAIKLNSFNFWIINLAGVLLLISIFFIIKYGWKIITEIPNVIKRQRNWLRWLIIILILIAVWQAYENRDTLFNPILDFKEKTNFSYFNPLDINYTSAGEKTKDVSGSLFENLKNTVTVPERDYDLIETRIFELVNEERTRYNARPLKLSSNLDSLARKWSEKMIAENFFEHSGYNVGENIGEVPIHYNVVGCGSTYTNEAMAQCFVTGWIESPGHHQNMIDKSYSVTGVGIACDISQCRATQMFS